MPSTSTRRFFRLSAVDKVFLVLLGGYFLICYDFCSVNDHAAERQRIVDAVTAYHALHGHYPKSLEEADVRPDPAIFPKSDCYGHSDGRVMVELCRGCFFLPGQRTWTYHTTTKSWTYYRETW